MGATSVNKHLKASQLLAMTTAAPCQNCASAVRRLDSGVDGQFAPLNSPCPSCMSCNRRLSGGGEASLGAIESHSSQSTLFTFPQSREGRSKVSRSVLKDLPCRRYYRIKLNARQRSSRISLLLRPPNRMQECLSYYLAPVASSVLQAKVVGVGMVAARQGKGFGIRRVVSVQPGPVRCIPGGIQRKRKITDKAPKREAKQNWIFPPKCTIESATERNDLAEPQPCRSQSPFRTH